MKQYLILFQNTKCNRFENPIHKKPCVLGLNEKSLPNWKAFCDPAGQQETLLNN